LLEYRIECCNIDFLINNNYAMWCVSITRLFENLYDIKFGPSLTGMRTVLLLRDLKEKHLYHLGPTQMTWHSLSCLNNNKLQRTIPLFFFIINTKVQVFFNQILNRLVMRKNNLLFCSNLTILRYHKISKIERQVHRGHGHVFVFTTTM